MTDTEPREVWVLSSQAVDDDEAGGAGIFWSLNREPVAAAFGQEATDQGDVDTEHCVYRIRVPEYVMPGPLEGLTDDQKETFTEWIETFAWRRDHPSLIARAVSIGARYPGGESRRIAAVVQ